MASQRSGAWLNALPISACGLRLDDEAIRIAVGLRLGIKLCKPDICTCGTLTDPMGYHGLSCKRGSGRIMRHNELNDIICRALSKAELYPKKEPSGLSRQDGKRPDGVTRIPWNSGRYAVWDVTVINTMAASYVHSTAIASGSAAEFAATNKCKKYSELSSEYFFVPIAFETFGPVNEEGEEFIIDIGRRIVAKTGDSREVPFLWQRLSIALQRWNAICFSETFTDALEQ